MIRISRLSSKDLCHFQTRYLDLSGLSIPPGYLRGQTVYGFFRRGQMIGGFILGKEQPLRTTEVFCSPDSRDRLNRSLESKGRVLEICCFWIERSFRKIPWINAWCWLRMAWAASMERSFDILLFGTNSSGLAKMYGYPKNAFLLHSDQIGGRDTYIFYAKRTHFLAGVFEIVLAKVFRKTRGFRSSTDRGLTAKLQTMKEMCF